MTINRVYSNCCCSCSFEPEILKIGQSSPKMYSNNIVNFQESTTILNACTKKSGNLLKAPHITLPSSSVSRNGSNGSVLQITQSTRTGDIFVE